MSSSWAFSSSVEGTKTGGGEFSSQDARGNRSYFFPPFKLSFGRGCSMEKIDKKMSGISVEQTKNKQTKTNKTRTKLYLRVQRSNIHCSLHSPKNTRKMRRGWSCFQLRIAREGLGPTYTELEHASLGKPPTTNTCVAPLPSIITPHRHQTPTQTWLHPGLPKEPPQPKPFRLSVL